MKQRTFNLELTATEIKDTLKITGQLQIDGAFSTEEIESYTIKIATAVYKTIRESLNEQINKQTKNN